MRILFVNSYYYPEIEGGAEYSVKYLAETLAANGHEVYVACTADEDMEETINGVHICRFRSHCIVRIKECYKRKSLVRKCHRLLDVYNPFNFLLLKGIVKRINPDIVHTNGLYDISPVIWHVASSMKIPVVHTLRDYFLICEHGNMMRRDTKLNCETTRFLCHAYRFANRLSSKAVNIVTAPSQFTLDTVCEAGLFPKAKKQVVYNATNIDTALTEQYARERIARMEGKRGFCFAFLGTLVELKGVKWLVESFAQIGDPEARLIICGKGELETYVVEACQKDSRIEYKGFLEQEEIKDVLLQADVLVCPSLWNEPFGRVVLDAYHYAVPVIASNMGALPSIVEDGATGLIVDKGNEQSLQQAMLHFMNRTAEYASFVENVSRAATKYTLSHQYEEFVKIYSEK